MTLASKSKPAILKITAELQKFFKLCHLRPTTGLLGIVVTCDHPNCKLWINQKAYAIEVLSWFNMLDCKAISTLRKQGVCLSKADTLVTSEDIEAMHNVPYI